MEPLRKNLNSTNVKIKSSTFNLDWLLKVIENAVNAVMTHWLAQ